jgi:hypothetical protein
MKATIHFYIRSERPNKDNTAKIYLLFSVGNQHTKITLSKSVPVKKDFFKGQVNFLGRAKLSK